MHYAKTASKLREQIIKFSEELSVGWPKVLRRFIAEAIYGIQACQSVRLTEIARSLEEKVPLRKTQYRLCRQLGRWRLWIKITEFLCRMASVRVTKDTLLVALLSFISGRNILREEQIVISLFILCAIAGFSSLVIFSKSFFLLLIRIFKKNSLLRKKLVVFHD